MPRDYRTERDAIIQKWYGGNPQPRNPRPRRSWREGPITPADCFGVPMQVNSPFAPFGHCLVWRYGLNRDGYGVLTIDGEQELARSRPVKWCKSASSCCCCLGGCRLREIGLRKRFVEGQNGGCEVSTSDDPFVVLLSQDGANEAAHGRPVREDAHHIGASPDLLVETLLWVVGPELLPVGEWEAGEGQDVGSRFVQ